ncbi:hypothetical protein F5B17DRAFT_387039 [Nemania serpens]|nr:hypothetical protein F5B17DRAFT_387039 [Nemania serpens]
MDYYCYLLEGNRIALGLKNIGCLGLLSLLHILLEKKCVDDMENKAGKIRNTANGRLGITVLGLKGVSIFIPRCGLLFYIA